MRKQITRSSLSVTLRLVSDIVDESKSASPNYGGERARSTTLQRTQDQQLSELVSCLEKQVEILQSKYLEAFATSSIASTTALVPLYAFTTEEDTTDER